MKCIHSKHAAQLAAKATHDGMCAPEVPSMIEINVLWDISYLGLVALNRKLGFPSRETDSH